MKILHILKGKEKTLTGTHASLVQKLEQHSEALMLIIF